ncbi:hypothetical protein Nmel_017278 [Mimus melanotis]
MDPRGAWWEL